MDESLPRDLMPIIPTDEDIQAFINAIRSGSIQKIKEMLCIFQQNIVNKLELQFRQPPLYFAAINSNQNLSFQMVKILVEAGGNPNFKDSNEQTIMFYACRDGKTNMVQYLLSKGCKIDEEDLYGQTPIFYAASEDRLQLLKHFSPEMIKHCDKLAKQTPLFYSTRKGHLQMCKQLISMGCDVNHHDSKNKTALDYARKLKFHDVVEFLSNETKKVKEIAKIQNQNEASENIQNQNKKKQTCPVNTNADKSSFKIVFYQDNGEIHDLTEDELRDLFRAQPNLSKFLSNPDHIPQEVLESSMDDSWQTLAHKILTECWRLKTSHWFYEPVDPVKYKIHDYFKIIKHPMDLGTVKKKLTYNAYESPKQFASDLSLVWQNCYRYNGEKHDVSKCAYEIEKVFNQTSQLTGFHRYLEQQ